MKKFETYFIRTLLIVVIAILALSPIAAVIHLLHGVSSAELDVTHLLSLGYLTLIVLGLFLISPAFSTNKQRPDRARPQPER